MDKLKIMDNYIVLSIKCIISKSLVVDYGGSEYNIESDNYRMFLKIDYDYKKVIKID